MVIDYECLLGYSVAIRECLFNTTWIRKLKEVYTRNNSQATLIYHSYFLVKHKSCSLVQQLSGFVPCIYMIFAKLGFLIIWWIQSSKDSVRRNFCQSVCVYSSLAGEYSAVMISRKRLLHVRNCNRNECYWTAVIN